MNQTTSFITRIILSLILVPALVGFVVLYSVSQNINEENVNDIAVSIIKQVLEAQILEKTGAEEINYNEFYEMLIDECKGRDSFYFAEFDFTLDCMEIENVSPEGLEEAAKSELDKVLREEVEKELNELGIIKYISLINVAIWILGIISILLILVIIFVSVPKYKALISLGIVGLILGSPFLFVRNMDLSYNLYNIEGINNLIEAILNSLYNNFAIVFIFGLVFIFIGMIWKVLARKGKDKEVKRKRK